MDVNSRNRTELKSYFIKNSIPTESNFAELIDGMLNQKEDGVVKLPGNPLSIEAVGDDNSSKKSINLYRNFSDAQPDWTINLNPHIGNNEGNATKTGFNISDGAGNSRLFIDRNTGFIGLGIVEPTTAIAIKKTSSSTPVGITQTQVGGTATLEITTQDNSGAQATRLLFRGGGDSTDTEFYRGKRGGEELSLYIRGTDGFTGLGTNQPATRLDVNGDVNVRGKMRFASNTGQLIYGDKRANRNTVVVKGHWDELEIKGRVIDWTGSNLHIGHEADHKDHGIYIGNGLLGKVEIQGTTNLIVGGVTTAKGGVVVGGNRDSHLNNDGAIYRYGGQMYITVDDNLYIRDSNNDIKFHFDTNNGIVRQQGWQSVSFQSGWVNYGGSYNPAGYFKDSLGIVHLRGLVKSGKIGNNQTIFTLPAGYRPANRELQIICRNS